MCGIAGRFNFDPAHAVDRAGCVAMTDAVAHRGPDADGFHLDGGIGLGHRRLSIIDLATGDQPLATRTASVWVVFNGEIYNFAEIRARARARSATASAPTPTPRSSCTATSSGASDCVDRFRGMFAFALWDAHGAAAAARPRSPRRQAALLRRDAAAGIVFGSEIKSLLEDPEVPRDWRAEALDAYLTLLYVPAPDTIYRGIHKLPPAHVLVAERGTVRDLTLLGPEFTGDGDAAREEEYLERARRAPARSRCGCAWSATCRSARSSPAASIRARSWRTWSKTSRTPPVTISVGFERRRRSTSCEHARDGRPASRRASSTR